MAGPGVYLASPLGFCAAGRLWREQVLLPAVAAAGLMALDPWQESVAVQAGLPEALSLPLSDVAVDRLRAANERIAAANLALIESAAGMLALLDGSDVDSGTACEIGYACALGKPVVGVRSDFRLAGDNAGAVVNLQVEHCVVRTGGQVVGTLDAALALLADLVRESAGEQA